MLFVVVILTVGLIVVLSVFVSTMPRLMRIGTLALLYLITYALRGGSSYSVVACGVLAVNLARDASGYIWNGGAAL